MTTLSTIKSVVTTTILKPYIFNKNSYGDSINSVSFGTTLQIKFQNNSCCGIVEACGFYFVTPAPTPDNFTDNFKAMVEELGQIARKGIVHLTFNTLNPGEPHQPKWFCDAVTSYPGAIGSEWVYNPNSGYFIQMWMLPTGQRKPA